MRKEIKTHKKLEKNKQYNTQIIGTGGTNSNNADLHKNNGKYGGRKKEGNY